MSGPNMSASEMARAVQAPLHPPQTLGAMRAAGLSIRCACRDCGREVVKPATALAARPELTLPELSRLLVCRDCNSKRVMTSLVEPRPQEDR